MEKLKYVSEGDEDRISNLPDDCLLRILSRLDTKNARQTSIFSKRWRYLWRDLPSLHFVFGSLAYVPGVDGKEKCEAFRKFVDDCLNVLQDKSNIQSFYLDSFKCRCHTSRITSWIHYAATHAVKDLRLRIISEGESLRSPPRVELPQCLFETIQVLSLDFFDLTHIKLPTISSYRQLRVLMFKEVLIRPGEQIEHLIANSLILETLILRGCKVDNLLELNISSITLKELVILIDHYPFFFPLDIKICAPNLTSITLVGFAPRNNFSLENVTALHKAKVEIEIFYSDYPPYRRELYAKKMTELLNSVRHVRDLTISKPSSVELISTVQAMFSNLKCLKLNLWLYRSCIPAIKHLLKNSPHIETLVIEREQVPMWLEKLDFQYEMEGAFNHLKTLEMKNFLGNNDEMEFLESLLKDAMHLEEVIFVVQSRRCAEELAVNMKIEKFQKASSNIWISFKL